MAAAVALMAAFGTPAAAQEPADGWSGCKPGTWLKFEFVNRFDDGDEARSTHTETLVELTDREVKVEILVEAPAYTNKKTETRPRAKAPPSDAAEKGTEVIAVGDRSFTCTITEFVSEGRTTRTWSCRDAPGGVVKSTQKGEAHESVSTLIASSEKVAVGEKTLSCWVIETKYKGSEAEVLTKTWFSADVPGHLVRREVAIDDSETGSKSTTQMRLVGFESKK